MWSVGFFFREGRTLDWDTESKFSSAMSKKEGEDVKVRQQRAEFNSA